MPFPIMYGTGTNRVCQYVIPISMSGTLRSVFSHHIRRGYASFFSYFFHFNRKLLLTTLTLLNAIAAPAIIGLRRNPHTG